jgi:hypothetical protein
MKWKSRRGISIVESAFIVPIMLMLVFGSIEFGTLLHLRHTMLLAARESARTIAVEGGSVSDAVAIANDLLPGDNLDFQVEATVPGIDDPNRDVTVAVSVPFAEASLGDMFGLFGDERMTVSVTMRSEQ